jgi:hypothetical protein
MAAMAAAAAAEEIAMLRHPILGKDSVEARIEDLYLAEKYIILSRDTKEPLLTVQRRGQGIIFTGFLLLAVIDELDELDVISAPGLSFSSREGVPT